jgi:two-component sensor histidine kinase
MPFGVTDKYLYLVQKEGVDVYDIETLKLIKSIGIPFYKLGHSCNGKDAFYVSADGAIYKIDKELNVEKVVVKELPVGSLQQLFVVHDSLYVLPRQSDVNTIYVLDNNMQLVQKIPVYASGVHRGIEQTDGVLWLYTSLGCKQIRADNGNEEKVIFQGKSISTILLDKNGNYWFATTNEGVYVVPDLDNNVYKLNGAKVRQIVATTEGILIGTQTGELLRLNETDGSLTKLSSDENSADIYYLYADAHNIIYSATGHTIVSREELNGKSKKRASSNNLAVKAVVVVDDKYYAMATSGMSMLMLLPNADGNKKSNWDTVHRYAGLTAVSGSKILLNGMRARAVAYDSMRQTLYFGTNNGIIAVSPSKTYNVTHNGKAIYAAQLVWHRGYTYVADAKGKLLRITTSGTTEELKNYAEWGSVRLLKACGKRLYYCGNRQLYDMTEPDNVNPVKIPIEADQINDITASDSVLWLATNNGLVSFVERSNKRLISQPGFYINTILVNEKEIGKNIAAQLPFDENNITIGYSIVEFAAAQPSVLSYNINGGEWKELPGNTRTLQFRSLSPGQYEVAFRVNGNDVDERVQFTIASPFWQQIWFYVFLVTVVLLVGLVYYSYSMKRKMKKVEEQKEKLHMEERLSRSMLTALRSQMNPHFFFNALNTVQAYIFTNEKSKASDYLAKLSMLTRTILEMSEAETVLLSSEIEALNLYLELERTRFGEDFKYSVVVENISEPMVHEIPSMIIQPFVENAVKHGLLHKEGEKLLHIKFVKDGQELRVTIDDNGIGRARSEALNEIKNRKYKSYSTRATAERVKLLNASTPDKIHANIIDKMSADGVAMGTMVLIKIKLA